MHSFIFAYGSKQLGEYMLGVKASPFKNLGAAMRIGLELFFGIKRKAPKIKQLDSSLDTHARTMTNLIQNFSHQVKLMFKEKEEALISNQTTQCRLSWIAIWMHAMLCSLSKLDMRIRNGASREELAHDRAMVDYIMSYGSYKIHGWNRSLRQNADTAMLRAADQAWKFGESLPNSEYYIPERTPDLDARGTGKQCDQDAIMQFGEGSLFTQEKVTSS